MSDLIRESVAHDVVRANPIPNAPVHPQMPGIEKMSRDTLVRELNVFMDEHNRLIRAIGRDIRRMLNGYSAIGNFKAGQGNPLNNPTYKILNAEWNARIEYWKAEERKKDVAAHNDDVALREEIIEALIEEGKARHVAANLTNTTPKMLFEGKRLGII